MFGYAAYAQPAYAALGSSIYAVSVNENIAFITDSEAVVATFIAFITETLTSADTSNATATYSNSVLENFTVADSIISVRTQYASALEPISFLEAPLGFAWVKINNTETTEWVLIDNRQ